MNPQIKHAIATYNAIRERLLSEEETFADDPELLADTLDGETDAMDIVARHVRLARETAAMAGALKGMISDMQERKKRLDTTEQRHRQVVLEMMEALGEKKLTRPDFTLTVRPGKQSVIVTDPDNIPSDYLKTEVVTTVDKVALFEALYQGIDVPGVSLSNGADTVSVRFK